MQWYESEKILRVDNIDNDMINRIIRYKQDHS